MSKRLHHVNIEKDLFNYLKTLNEDELIRAIYEIGGGIHKYSSKFYYLEKKPDDLINAYLEKIIFKIARYNGKLDNISDKGIEYILDKFLDNFPNAELKDIHRFTFNGIELNRNIRDAKWNNYKGKYITELFTICLIASYIISSYNTSEDVDILAAKEGLLNGSESYIVEHMASKEEESPYVYDEPVNEEEYTEEDTYTEDVPAPSYGNYEEAISEICSKYNLTYDEFDIVCATVMFEAKGNCYEDAYAVINCLYNRTNCSRWVDTVDEIFDDVPNAGRSLYYQLIAPWQFEAYFDDWYKEFLGVREGENFQAVIDFLLTEECIHNYLSFRSSDTDFEEYEIYDTPHRFAEGGNQFFAPMQDYERLEPFTR